MIAEKNNIKIENLQWYASVHDDKENPHCHIMFWDKSQQVAVNFVHPKKIDEIRKELVKRTFGAELKEYYITNNNSERLLRENSVNFARAFENLFSIKNFEISKESSANNFFPLSKKEVGKIDDIAEMFEELKELCPPKNSLKYHNLKRFDPDFAKKIDELGKYLLENYPDLKKYAHDYITGRVEYQELFYSKETPFGKGKIEKSYIDATKKVEKIIGNQIISIVKNMRKQDFANEKRLERAEKWEADKEAWLDEKRPLWEAEQKQRDLDELERNVENGITSLCLLFKNASANSYQYLGKELFGRGDLSKEEIMEIIQKNKDKGRNL